MKITKNTVVTLYYTVTDEAGEIISVTPKNKPQVALIGSGHLVPGLEKALEDHVKGEELAVKVEPKDAFGEINESLLQTIDRAMFGDYPINVGDRFVAGSSLGDVTVAVKEIKENEVIVDANHPLAGKTLNFLVEIEDVREATQEELEHGHAHPDGMCPSEHHCGCGGHGGGHGCCGGHGHHHEDGEHECCGGHGHHHGKDGEHECCGGHGHHHDEDGEHQCGCKH